MTATKTRPAQPGIAVSTQVAAGGFENQHAEGIVVSTRIAAGGLADNHVEGVVVATAIRAGSDGTNLNHAETVLR